MTRRLVGTAATTALLALLAGGIVGTGHAGAGKQNACRQVAALRSVFPRAKSVRFTAHNSVKRHGIREPFRERKCGGWWTTYTGYRGTGAYVDVSVMLYKTRRGALAGLAEPIAGPEQTFPDGVRLRTRVKTLALDSGVTSVVGNVVVVSVGSGPEDVYSGAEAVRAWTRIHRRIHAAVLGLR